MGEIFAKGFLEGAEEVAAKCRAFHETVYLEPPFSESKTMSDLGLTLRKTETEQNGRKFYGTAVLHVPEGSDLVSFSFPKISIVEDKELVLIQSAPPEPESPEKIIRSVYEDGNTFGITMEGFNRHKAVLKRNLDKEKLRGLFEGPEQFELSFRQAMRAAQDPAGYFADYLNLYPEKLPEVLRKRPDIIVRKPMFGISDDRCTVRDGEIILGSRFIKGVEAQKEKPKEKYRKAEREILDEAEFFRESLTENHADFGSEYAAFGCVLSVGKLRKILEKLGEKSAVLVDVKNVKSKKMIICQAEDVNGPLELIIFQNLYPEANGKLRPGEIVSYAGKKGEKGSQVLLSSVRTGAEERYLISREKYDIGREKIKKTECDGGGQLYILEPDGRLRKEKEHSSEILLTDSGAAVFPRLPY